MKKQRPEADGRAETQGYQMAGGMKGYNARGSGVVGKKAPALVDEDEADAILARACIRDLETGRTHLVPRDEMDAILQKIRG